MTVNPNESPLGVEHLPHPNPTPPREKGCGSAVVLILATIGGGLAGNVFGNLLAFSVWMLQRPTGATYSIFGINHLLSFVLLVVGGFVGAYLAIRITDQIALR
jgi:CBS domain containing-hemolysin-like protein